MADRPFDRTIIHPLEKPLSVDINQAQAQVDRSLRQVLYDLLAARTSSSSEAASPVTGFLGQSFRVVAASPSSMNVTVKKGVGFIDMPADVPAAIDSVLGLDDLCSYKPVVLMSDVSFAVPAAHAALVRIDIIEVKTNRLTENPLSRQILDPSSGAFSPNVIDKTLAFAVDGSTGTVTSPAESTAALSYKVGVAGGGTPATSTGYTKIGEVYVAATDTAIAQNEIIDRRRLLHPGGGIPIAAQWRLQYNAGTPIVTAEFVSAPPGVMIGGYAPAGFGRGEFEVWIAGGEIAGGVVDVRGVPRTTPGIAEFVVVQQDSGFPVRVASASSGNRTEAAAATPPVHLAIGATAINAFTRGRYQTAGTTNNTNALLEDLTMILTGMLYY